MGAESGHIDDLCECDRHHTYMPRLKLRIGNETQEPLRNRCYRLIGRKNERKRRMPEKTAPTRRSLARLGGVLVLVGALVGVSAIPLGVVLGAGAHWQNSQA